MRWGKFEDFFGFFLMTLFLAALTLCVVILMSGCSPKVVAVPEVHHEYQSHTDSVIICDSVIDRQTNIIREVDSATMSQYGITLKNAERAWLIQSDRLQREIQQLKERSNDTIEVRDTINVPYPVEVVKKPSFIDRVKQYISSLLLICIILFILWFILKRRNS